MSINTLAMGEGIDRSCLKNDNFRKVAEVLLDPQYVWRSFRSLAKLANITPEELTEVINKNTGPGRNLVVYVEPTDPRNTKFALQLRVFYCRKNPILARKVLFGEEIPPKK